MSGAIAASGRPPRLSRIANPGSPHSGTGSYVSASIDASGGASSRSRVRKRSTEAPSTSTTTPDASLSTNPDSPSSVASPCTIRPEAHALHHAGDPCANSQSSSTSVWYALACASWIRGMCSERTMTTWSANDSDAIRPPS